jgi:hypothetical protein
MALPTVKLKRSSVAGKIPDSSDLAYGELAVNYSDGKIYYKNSSNAIKSFLDSGNIVDLVDSNYVTSRLKELRSNLSLNTYNIVDSGNINITGTITSTGIVSGSELTSTNAAADEGGQINLAKPPNATLSGGITIDAFQNKLRFFVQGGDARGAFIDLSSTTAGVGTNLLTGGTGSPFDSADFNSMFAAKSTTDLSEGTNKYYTKARADSDDKFPTTFTYTAGTTAGPTGSLTGTNLTPVSFAAIPSASATASGIVTTGTQTFAGTKTFSSTITGSITGNAGTATTLATGRDFSLTGEVTAPAVSFNGSGVVALNTTIAANAVDSSNILALSVSSAKIQNSAVTTAKIATGAVDSNALGALSVSSAKLQGSIPDSKLATIATAGKVSNSATTATNLNTASAIVARDGSGNFTAGTITATLSGSASTLTTAQNFSLTGEVTAPTVSFNGSGAVALNTTIAANAVDSSNILALSVSSGKIQSAAVTTAKFATGAVDSNALGALSVSSAKIQNNAVALGTQTTGNYVASASAANGVKITGTAGEGWTPIVSLDSTGTGTIGNLTVGSNLIVSGNLTVSGTTTTINTETITLNDNIIILNNNATGVPTENAGIEIERGDSANVLVRWNETTNRWSFTNDGTNYHNIPTTDEYIDSATSKYPTTYTWTGGTTAGPTGSLTGNNLTAISFGAIPSASATASGIITTDAQTIAGVKTFSSTITGSITGNAGTATTLATGRNFSLTGEVTAAAISFNGSGAVALSTTIATDAVDSSNILALSVSTAKIQSGAVTTAKIATGAVDSNALGALSVSSAKLQASIPDSKLATISTAGKVANSATTATNLNTASAIVARDGSGNFTAGTITAALSGNASTATTLATARNIGGVSFNGSADINLPGVNTAGNQNTSGSAATLTTARTIGDVSFNGSANIVPERILYKDTRAVNHNPYAYVGTTLHLKTNTTDGLADGGTYHGVLDLAHWGDSSGGKNHQLGLTDNNNIYIRASTNATTWGSWVKIIDSGDTTALNTANTLVRRDASGNFSAGTITTAALDTATAATHYYVETASDGAIRPKTLANVQTEVVTTTVLGSGTANGTTYLAGDRTWKTVSAGATGGGSDTVFFENSQVVTTNYTITDGKNAMTAGPVTINNGVTITIGDGEVWTIV